MKNNKDTVGRIYMISNSINDKKYIGQTISTIKERLSQHKCDSKRRDTAMCHAINKYSPENFIIETLEDNIPYELLDEKEIYYIKKYKTICPFGYNMTEGGQTYKTDEERQRMSDRVKGEKNPIYGMCGELNPFYGREHTDETRDILSQRHKDTWNNLSEEEYNKRIAHLDEMREKMIDMYGGGFAGNHHTEEVKQVIREKMQDRIFTDEHKKRISENSYRKQKVVMLDKEGNYINEFDSMTIACEYVKEKDIHSNPKGGEISNVCRNKRKTAYGHVWVYYDNYTSGNYKIEKKYKKENNKIICINNGLIFETFASAGNFANINGTGIWSCCNKTQKTAGKLSDGTPLSWMYYEEYLEMNKDNLNRKEAI